MTLPSQLDDLSRVYKMLEQYRKKILENSTDANLKESEERPPSLAQISSRSKNPSRTFNI